MQIYLQTLINGLLTSIFYFLGTMNKSYRYLLIDGLIAGIEKKYCRSCGDDNPNCSCNYPENDSSESK